MKTAVSGQNNNTTAKNFFDPPRNCAILFSNQNSIYKKKIEKRQTKFIEKISFIKPFLRENEKINLVTTGCSPTSFPEQCLAGLVAVYLKRCLILFTNERILHIPTKWNYSYRNSIARIFYADCQSVVVKRGKLVIRYKNGDKEVFPLIARKEKKKINALMKTVSLEGEGSKEGGRTHLCPRCTGELIKNKYSCPVCHLTFKDRTEAGRISIIYPGGGYFYTRHPLLGASDALTEFAIILFIVVTFIESIRGVEGSIIALAMFGIILIIEKAVTIYHSQHFIKEFIPKESVDSKKGIFKAWM